MILSRLDVRSRFARVSAITFVIVTVAMGETSLRAQSFVRGDVNRDGLVDWGDATAFVDGFRGYSDPRIRGFRPRLPCFDAADVNDDGVVLLDDFSRPGGVPLVFASDLDDLVEFLMTLAPGTGGWGGFMPPAPFPNSGRDLTADDLGCTQGVEPPREGSGAYGMLWEGPERVNPGDAATFTLRASAPVAMQAFSLAYIVDARVFEVRNVRIAAEIMDGATRRELESSRRLQWTLASFPGIFDNGLRLLRVGLIFADEDFDPIDTPPTRGPTRDFPLVRVSGRVSPSATSGSRFVMTPFDGPYAADLGRLVGGIGNQIVVGSESDPIEIPEPLGALIPILNVGEISFLRADSNGDGAVDLSDATRTLSFLFLETNGFLFAPDAADSNDSGSLDLSDPVHTLNYLFVGGPPPPPPFPGCGPDPTVDALEGFQVHCFE